MIPSILQWTFYIYFSLVLSPGSTGAEAPPPNRKKAYSEHYQGALLFSEGAVKRANDKFRQAYNILPENFYFALSYGLSEGRLGHKENGLHLIKKAFELLNRRDPDYVYKRCIATFLNGMVYSYGRDYGHAYASVRDALSIAPDTAELKSVMENTLGYLTLINQSQNFHKSSKLAPHIHIRKHDLEKAHQHFTRALELDPDNGTAFKNYKTLSDTLGLAVKFREPTAQQASKNKGPTFLYMHQKIIQDLNLKRFDELVFLVDVSGSMVSERVICMNDTRFAVMKDLGRKIVKELPDQTQLGLGTIGGDCPDEPAHWKGAGSIIKKDLDSDLRFLIPDGTTPLLTMLLKSPELFSDSLDTSKTLFLVSDGANTCSAGGTDICEFAETLKRKGITVNVLTFLNSTYNNTNAFSEYICLADNTGGNIIYMDNYRCHFKPFNFDLVWSCHLTIPKFSKSSCWGKHIQTLWMYFEDSN